MEPQTRGKQPTRVEKHILSKLGNNLCECVIISLLTSESILYHYNWFCLHFLPLRLPPPSTTQTETENGRVVEDMDSAAQANQRRMNADPLEVMLLNMGYRITGLRGVGPDGSDDEDSSEGQVQCRPS